MQWKDVVYLEGVVNPNESQGTYDAVLWLHAASHLVKPNEPIG